MTKIYLGVDEAGRGAWAGPVVASAFAILKNQFKKSDTYKEIDDSKRLSKRHREKLFEALHRAKNNGEVIFSVAAINSEIIDMLGIKEANRLGMEMVIIKVLKDIGESASNRIEIQIDGNDHYQFDCLQQKKNIEIREFIRGDQLFKVIGAASILAKVTRDQWMTEYGISHKAYHFDQNKGYGTLAHQIALETFGILDIHRKSYSPIKHLILGEKKI